MATDTTLSAGDFCWIELTADNIERASQFYVALFDWGSEHVPCGTEEPYHMYKIGDTAIGGGFQINSEMKAKQVPQHWKSYVLVANIDESLKTAKSLGATVYKDVSEVMNVGKMAVIADPTGAVFSLWQTLQRSEGSPLPSETFGNVGWHELVTTDTEAAGKFYTELFKWTQETQKMPEGHTYTTFKNGEKFVGGMMKPDKEDTLGQRWNVYFSVSDLDESIAKAKKLGGTLCYEPITIDVGRFTMIRDPEGIFFSIIQFKK
jgi:predicted enzyme related to lactoylglutathione lyase